jgi:hypothetical protein
MNSAAVAKIAKVIYFAVNLAPDDCNRPARLLDSRSLGIHANNNNGVIASAALSNETSAYVPSRVAEYSSRDRRVGYVNTIAPGIHRRKRSHIARVIALLGGYDYTCDFAPRWCSRRHGSETS